jgi:UDP-N-acetylglucosamine 4,6-dehydratase
VTPIASSRIDGKRILITGGTGSFGSTVVKRLVKDYRPERIVIFSRDEKKQHDMRLALNSPLLDFQIGDTRDMARVQRVMSGIDLVFHAAALKQVPSCEFFPIEAVKTNILGTNNVVEAAIAEGVEKLIALSTDKAVYPINAMGMSKALMEKTVVANARLVGDRTTLCCVRYGNVMYSRGSVIPLFVDQLRAGKPLTITEASMTRFLLPLPVAIDLVIHALENGRPGDTFVRKSPASTVGDLAQAMKELFAVDSEIRQIGIRHGEKLYETLVTQEELMRAEDMGDFYRIPSDTRDLNYAKFFAEGQPMKLQEEGYNSNNTEQLDVEGTKALLLQLTEIQEDLARWHS